MTREITLLLLQVWAMEIPEFVDKTRNYYTLLNCGRSSTTEQIHTEYRLLALTHHPDRPQSDTVQGSSKETFQKIEEAKRVLLDPDSRLVYDQWLDCGLSIPFPVWRDKFSKRTNMHWGNPKEAVPKLMEQETSSNPTWSRHTDPNIELFRQGKL